MTDETKTPVGTALVVNELAALRDDVRQLGERMARPAEGIFNVGLLNRTHVRMRAVEWLIAIELAAGPPSNITVDLRVGTAIVASVQLSPETPTLMIRLPLTIDRAADVATIIGAGGTLVSSLLTYYPE